MTTKNPDLRCKARAKSGKRCRAAPTAGGLCFFHANPNKAAELGRIGGRSKRRASAGENLDPLPTLDNVLAVQDTIAGLIADVRAGRIHPQVGACLSSLLKLQLDAVQTTDLDRRLAKVEELVAEKDELLAGEDEYPGSYFSQVRKPPRKA